MDISKEETLKIINELNSKRIDIKRTIEKAAEFEGERGISIFQKKNAPIFYNIFSSKKDYKFDFLSERFYKVMNAYYISNKGIFITLAKGYNKITVNNGSDDDYTIKTMNNEYGFSSDKSHLIAYDYGIKVTEDGVQKVQFGCMFTGIICGYGGAWGFSLIERDGDDFNYNSLNNPVNKAAIKMMFDEIVFE